MKQKYLLLFSLSGLILSIDQLTKNLVFYYIPLGEKKILLPLLALTHIQSSEFAFGLFKKVPDGIKTVFFIGIPIFALILIILIFIKLRDDKILTSIALATILGGAIGNLIDRLQHGFVIDSLVLYLSDYFFVPFNVADIAIVFGVIVMLRYPLFHDHHGNES